jgi:putative phosphoesterase
MLIGVVSDTHGHMQLSQAALRMLSALDVDAMLHCGDVGTPEIVELFAPWSTHFVLGNVDRGQYDWAQIIQNAGQHFHGDFGSLEWDGKRIAFLHGDDTRRLEETIRSGAWDLVCHGHTHVARQQQIDGTLVLNPGAVYRANPHSVAVVELPTLAVNSIAF